MDLVEVLACRGRWVVQGSRSHSQNFFLSAGVCPSGRTARARKPCPYESFSINGHGDLRTSPLRTDDLLGFRQHETPSESTWTKRQHAASRPSGASRTAASERPRGTI